MATKEPVLCCNIYPTIAAGADVLIPGLNISVNGMIHMPFSLTPVTYTSSCEGIHISVPNLNVMLSGVMPLLQLCDCVLKLIKFAQAMTDALGPPPDPSKITKALSDLGHCFTLLLSWTLPLAFLDFCKLIRDIIRFILLVLWCIRNSLQVKLESDSEAAALVGSADARLQDMGACLTVQNAALQTEIEAKLNGVELLLSAINILIGLVPGMGAAVQTSPTGVTIAAIDDMIAAIKLSLNPILVACP